MHMTGNVFNHYRRSVAIGLPVYNGDATIRAAISSVLKQTYPYIELIISDNYSNDDTELICMEYAAADSRVRYVRHAENIGPTKNFQWLLDNSTANYFMWLAADDSISPTYIEDNVRVLAAYPKAVSSMTYCSSDMLNIVLIKPEYKSIDSISPSRRINAYLSNPGSNDRFYSLHRSTVLKSCLPFENFVASDWLLVIRLLKIGPMLSSASHSYYNKARDGASSSYNSLTKFMGAKGFFRIFPQFPFTIAVYKELPVPSLAHLFAVRWLLVNSLPWQLVFRPLLVKAAKLLRSLWTNGC